MRCTIALTTILVMACTADTGSGSPAMQEHMVELPQPVEVSAVATAQARHEAEPKEWIAPWLRPGADEILESICPENTFRAAWIKKGIGGYDTNDIMNLNPHGLISCSVGLGLQDGMPSFEIVYVTPVPTGDYKPPKLPSAR